MSRSKELKNISAGLYGSFISRNNDMAGYWGVGKLCLLAEEYKINTVCIDLLANTIMPKSDAFSTLLANYRSALQRHMRVTSVDACKLSSATIDLNFSPGHPPEKIIPIVTRGKLFKLTVLIIDANSKRYEVSGYSYCGPHNPKRESKSTRADER